MNLSYMHSPCYCKICEDFFKVPKLLADISNWIEYRDWLQLALDAYGILPHLVGTAGMHCHFTSQLTQTWNFQELWNLKGGCKSVLTLKKVVSLSCFSHFLKIYMMFEPEQVLLGLVQVLVLVLLIDLDSVLSSGWGPEEPDWTKLQQPSHNNLKSNLDCCSKLPPL